MNNKSTDPVSTNGKKGQAPWPTNKTAWITVFILFLTYAASYMDRIILTILIEPIQQDFDINDSQIALLHGLAFVIFYVGLGIPFGVLADRVNRKKMIAICIAFWSVVSASCGLAQNFTQLFIARLGVGVGEAGLSPAAYSMIGDNFPAHKRASAMAGFVVAIFIGGGLALMGGGLIAELVGSNPTTVLPLLGEVRSWQAVFIIVGLSSLPLVLLVLALKEPIRRTGSMIVDVKGNKGIGFKAQFSRHKKSYILHFLAFGFLGVPFNVTLLWARPFLSRTEGLSTADATYIIGILMIVFCTAGVVTGSRIADNLQRKGRADGTILVGIIAALGVILPLSLFPFMSGLFSVSIMLGLSLFFAAFAYGAGPAALQLITPNNQRAVMSAIYLLSINLIGLTIGPTLTGAVTDYVFKDPAMTGFSVSIVGASGGAISAILFYFLLRSFKGSVLLEEKLSPGSGQ